MADVLVNRRKVLVELQSVTGINPANAISVVQDEIDLIEARLEELKTPPDSMPENKWS